MPIKISSDLPFIPSATSYLFREELRRYCLGKTGGRSFLIAGHRGAGKTTLVNHAIEELRKEPLTRLGPPGLDPREQRLESRRILRVDLHGPDLIMPTGPSTTGSATHDPNEGDPRIKRALEQMIVAMYRALVGEVTTCYRDRVVEQVRDGKGKSLELLERAAQLQVELDEYPGRERLRDYWDAGRFLNTGVMFKPSSELPPDQGLRELVAVSTACEVYRRISGTFKDDHEQGKTGASDQEDLGVESGEVWNAAVSLLTGGILGTGFFVGTKEPVSATVSGVIGALGASAVLRMSRQRSRTRSLTREYTFLPDRSVATLDRALPVLIQRLDRAGLVPVFVVDELDKVADLSARMQDIVGHLKKFVSEQAFFCFLTDRSYYEYLHSQSVRHPYPIEHTYFTDRIFVAFRCTDLQGYLEKILVVEGGNRPGTGSLGGLDKEQQDDDEADRSVLPYVLLHRAQMHAIDLQRQLNAVRDADGQVVSLGVRTKRDSRFDLMIQLAIHMLLDEEEMRGILDRDPAFARMIYDALYYPVRLRAEGHAQLDLSEKGEEAFKRHLIGRMATDSGPGTKNGPAPIKTDLQFLYDRVRELARLLEDPFAFQDALNNWQTDETTLNENIHNAVPFQVMLRNGSLLWREFEGKHRYRWGYDYLGRSLNDGSRTALGYQFDHEFRLAVQVLAEERQVTALSASRNEAELWRSALWVPYRQWAAGSSTFDPKGRDTTRVLRQLGVGSEQISNLQEDLVALAVILAAPDKFAEHLNQGERRTRYKRVVEHLAPHAPLLLKRDDGLYQWQYEHSGRALRYGLEVRATGDGVAWPDQVEFIREVAAAIESVTDERLNLTSLASSLHIITTSPAWTDVERALTRLEAAYRTRHAYPDHQSDIEVIGDFAHVLESEGGTIALALACGAVVGGATGDLQTRPGQRVQAGLQAISQVCGLGSSVAGPARGVFERLAHQAGVLAAGAFVPSPTEETGQVNSAAKPEPHATREIETEIPSLQPGSVAAWTAWVQSRVECVHQTDLATAERRAWQHWKTRLENYLLQSETGFEPELDDVLCQIAGRGPATILRRYRLGGMTLIEWSDVLFRALTDPDCPLWLAVPALAALGFGGSPAVLAESAHSDEAFRARADDLDETVLQSWIPAAKRRTYPPARCALLLKNDRNTAANSWPPPQRGAAVLWTTTQMRTLLQQRVAGLLVPHPPSIEHVVGMVPPREREGLTAEIRTALGEKLAEIKLAWVEHLYFLGNADQLLDQLVLPPEDRPIPAHASVLLRTLSREDLGRVPRALRDFFGLTIRTARCELLPPPRAQALLTLFTAPITVLALGVPLVFLAGPRQVEFRSTAGLRGTTQVDEITWTLKRGSSRRTRKHTVEAEGSTLIYRLNRWIRLGVTARVENGTILFTSPGVWSVMPRVEAKVIATGGTQVSISLKLSWLGIVLANLEGAAKLSSDG